MLRDGDLSVMKHESLGVIGHNCYVERSELVSVSKATEII